MVYNVFLSYSTKDFPSVDTLRNFLQLPEVNCFVSEYSVTPGVPLAPTIQIAIRACDLFIVLWSKNAAASEWVPQEIGLARGSNKPILPFVLEEGSTTARFYKRPSIRSGLSESSTSDVQPSGNRAQELDVKDEPTKHTRRTGGWRHSRLASNFNFEKLSAA